MIIRFFDRFGSASYTIGVDPGIDISIFRKISYVQLMSLKTKAYDYGPAFDKWFTEISITGLNEDIQDIFLRAYRDVGQIEIELEDYERVFGAGIDYSNTIVCNVLNATRPMVQENAARSRMSLSLEAVEDSVNGMLQYLPGVPATLPDKLNFQKPVNRDTVKRETAFSTQKWGKYGKAVEVDDFRNPVSKFALPLVFSQNDEQAAQIEKFVHTQRVTPFQLTEADFVFLFPAQQFSDVIITDFKTRRVGFDRWQQTLNITTNV